MKITLKLVGDFYEAYGEDAKTMAKALNFTLTSKRINGIRTPLSGMPFWSSSHYISQLNKQGIKVSIS